MSNYTPPDALNVELNFKDELGSVDSHNVALNFGGETAFSIAQIKVKTAFKFRASGINVRPVDNHGRARIPISCRLSPRILGSFDINHLLGVSKGFQHVFNKAVHRLINAEIPWFKSILRVSNEALFFDQGLVISHGNKVAFERGQTLSESIYSVFDQGAKLSRNQSVHWQENLKIRIARDLYFDESIKLR